METKNMRYKNEEKKNLDQHLTIKLNFFTFDTSRMILHNFIFNCLGFRCDFRRTVKLAKSFEMSRINNVDNQQRPAKNKFGGMPDIDIENTNQDSTSKAIAYPNDVFQLNGNLEQNERKRLSVM